MSSARRKGNRLESDWAADLHAVDGHDPGLAQFETPTGRLGNTYRWQVDVASQRVKSECKNREDNPARLWTWLDQLRDTPQHQVPVLVLGRNRRRPLVVMDAQDFLKLLEGSA